MENRDIRPQSPYATDIIIDFKHGFDCKAFSRGAERISKKYASKMKLISGKQLLESSVTIDEITGARSSNQIIRIYISGHCKKASDILVFKEDDPKQNIHVSALAERLASFIGDKKVIIILNGCETGKGNDINSSDSFGAKLHRALLEKTKRDTFVVAKNSYTTEGFRSEGWQINIPCKFTTKPEVLIETIEKLQKIIQSSDINSPENQRAREELKKVNVWHQSGSKVIFRLNENNEQIRVDAYVDKWKPIVFKTLKDALQNASKEKKYLLTDWLTKFDKLSDLDIYLTIKNELGKSKSVLKEKPGFFSNLFTKETKPGPFEQLIKYWDDASSSATQTVKTGYQFVAETELKLNQI